jgi:hypothetical protein
VNDSWHVAPTRLPEIRTNTGRVYLVGTTKALNLLLQQQKLTAIGLKAHTTGWVPPSDTQWTN